MSVLDAKRVAANIPELSASQGDNAFRVVAIGASSGGLDACTNLLRALPARTGMAIILVQHLDPDHESLLAGLLAEKTSLTVREAAEGMIVAPENLYVIRPGTYLSVEAGALHLSAPKAKRGARLPFDFLLKSVAEQYGARSVCVVLSGTGADGSEGLRAIKARGGLVLVQAPAEAAYDGMPASAIATGETDGTLPVKDIAAALARAPVAESVAGDGPAGETDADVDAIIQLLRTTTPFDFSLYKRGTLRRRMERRAAMLSTAGTTLRDYCRALQKDAPERDRLSKDLLIHVTSFFRDPAVFTDLASSIIPGLVKNVTPGQSLRLWVAGCSTGEETYSLAMLFQEAIAAAGSDVKLQVFASDVDPDAIATARDGLYPATIAADVSAARLARFFVHDEHGYRVTPDLRQAVVFTVQDVLADPPFSRMDFVSCRNLLIYLQPEAQAKVRSVLRFALRPGGTLLLGTAETVGREDGRFEIVSKPNRLYRRTGRSRPGEFSFLGGTGEAKRDKAAPERHAAPTRDAKLGDLCRCLVSEAYAPAAVLIGRSHECLFSLGPTERYLRIAPGQPTHDLLAMAPNGLRTKLRFAVQRAIREGARVRVAGGAAEAQRPPFDIVVQPVSADGEDLLLVCFVDTPASAPSREPAAPQDAVRVAELERALDDARTDLAAAVQSLEESSEEQRAINQEALSVNEEHQSTNEELLTSKEELQSLNEELTLLNAQLQETLERQRTTSDDLQNVLYSTDVATLFLDTKLAIRFFTPATRAVFSVIPGDIGRPLADLQSLATDTTLAADAGAVLQTQAPVELEIETRDGRWFTRKILPYRTHDGGVGGVVITFADVTERRRAAEALDAARLSAETATAAKSRFLAAASHDLRQPLQTLALLQGLLSATVQDDKAQTLVARMDLTLGAMSGMLNTLLDINQIEAGVVQAEPADFAIDDLLTRMRDEFLLHAQAKTLGLRVVTCGLRVRSDPRLLEQMVRNLISNALKYTRQGRVLLGCRRRAGTLSVEIWDTGIGIADTELQAIFDEYHQIGNDARERTRGLGLGLSIVQRLAGLLGHRVRVRSRPGHGSMFAIDVPLAHGPVPLATPIVSARKSGPRTGAVLVVEDDPELRDLLELLLGQEGYGVTTAGDGAEAIDLVTRGVARPDFLLTDYNLPGGLDGLDLAARLQRLVEHRLPALILTGDIAAGTLRRIADAHHTQMSKPVKPHELMLAIGTMLARARAPSPAEAGAAEEVAGPVIYVVDDDAAVRAALRDVLEDSGQTVEDFAGGDAFLRRVRPDKNACLLVDALLPGMSGLEVLRHLRDAGNPMPAIMITGNGDVPMAVRAMAAGAADFIEKPVGGADLLASIARALDGSRDAGKLATYRAGAARTVAGLTPRQRQILDLVVAGQPSKNIAADLGMSQRTVENHRASIMRKTGSKSLPALARLALAADENGGRDQQRQDPPATNPVAKHLHQQSNGRLP